MIKINLATRKQSGVVAVGKGKASGKAAPKFNLEQFRELPIGRLVMVTLAGYAISMGLDGYMADEVLVQEGILAKVNAGNAKLQQDLVKFRAYDAVKKSMDEDEKTIRTKLTTVQNLVADKAISLKILLALSSSIPKDVWLRELKLDKTDISMKGSSLGFSAISDFMKTMHEVPYFSNVELIDTQEAKEGRDKGLANFELSAKRR